MFVQDQMLQILCHYFVTSTSCYQSINMENLQFIENLVLLFKREFLDYVMTVMMLTYDGDMGTISCPSQVSPPTLITPAMQHSNVQGLSPALPLPSYAA